MVFEFHTLGDNDDISLRFFTLAFGIRDFAVRKRTVNNASFKRVHRLKRNLTAQTHRLLSKFLCKCGECFFAFFAIVFAIHYDLFKVAFMLVEEGERKILKCIERLSSVSDCHTAVVALNGDVKSVVFLFHRRARGEPHTFKRAVDKLCHLVGYGVFDGNSDFCLGEQSALGKHLDVNLVSRHPEFHQRLFDGNIHRRRLCFY